MRWGDPPRPEVKVGDWNTLDMVEDTDMAWTSLHGRRCGNSRIHSFASGRILKPSCVKDTLDVLDRGFAGGEGTGRGSSSCTKNQACSLVSHCTSSPTRERRGRH